VFVCTRRRGEGEGEGVGRIGGPLIEIITLVEGGERMGTAIVSTVLMLVPF
jgi:hypothetical protein